MINITQELIVHTFPCLSDNYGFLIHDPVSGDTACIDTPDAGAINKELKDKGWQLTHIFNTHHHWDHIGGNLELKEIYQCEIVASDYDHDRIPGLDRVVSEGDTVSLGEHKATVDETPGHTLGHIVYHFENEQLLFAGDTIFAMGCGRLFEGSAEQMFHSLEKIKHMPDETTVYCAHEYTEANAEFALTVEKENKALKQRYAEVKSLRKKQIPTVPFLLIEEKQTNPFLLANSVEEFAERRTLKDNF